MTEQAPPERVWLMPNRKAERDWTHGEWSAGQIKSPLAREYLSRPHHDALMAEARAEVSTARALEVLLSRLKFDRQTADILRRHLGHERANSLDTSA